MTKKKAEKVRGLVFLLNHCVHGPYNRGKAGTGECRVAEDLTGILA